VRMSAAHWTSSASAIRESYAGSKKGMTRLVGRTPWSVHGRALAVLPLIVSLAACDDAVPSAPTGLRSFGHEEQARSQVDCDTIYDTCVDHCGDSSACEMACDDAHGRCSGRCDDLDDDDARDDCEDGCDDAKSECEDACQSNAPCEDACEDAKAACEDQQ